MTVAAPAICRATDYARKVVAGAVAAGLLVRRACERHLADIADGPARGLRWDAAEAARAIGFVERFCRLGHEDESVPFVLEPWQAFVVGSLFGWKGPDGFRRFRLAYIEAGKGNGKSPLLAAVGLLMLLADGESQAEVYAAATKREQAAILFRDAASMVRASPDLARRVEFSGSVGKEWNIAYHKTGSFFRIVSSDKKQSGPRVHCGLIDEIHEHDSPRCVDMMRAGTKGRRQALIVEITNSGHDRESVCWKHHDYSASILQGRQRNDAWFAYVCHLDSCAKHREEGHLQPVEGCAECDDWRDEAVWTKANPNLGVSVTAKYLREQVAEAEGMPSRRNTVQRLNFCVWTQAVASWISPEVWARGNGPLDREALRGRRCFGGLDIASTTDIAAFVRLYPDFPVPGRMALLCRFWIPEAAARTREDADGIPYSVWEREGRIAVTPGDTIDIDEIERAVREAHDEGGLEGVGFDPWNAAQACTHLMAHGVAMQRFGQNLQSLNEPSKRLEADLKEGRVAHGDDPVLRWMAGNAAVYTDASGNIRPVKPDHASGKKIDGIVAAVMARGLAMVAPESQAIILPEVW